jgi:ubiquinone/menaquinone biosynthesis C-methylase UbiE
VSAHRWATDYFERPGTVAEWWDPLSGEDPAFRAWYLQQLDDLVALTCPSGKTVLDAGTGRGRAAVSFALAGADEVIAADISDEMLGHARALAHEAEVESRISFVRTDLEQLPLEDGSCDVALLLEIMLHLSDPRRVLAELARVLRPGGALVVTTNGANPLARLFQPAKQGSNPAPRWKLGAATLVNELMTAAFGFTWKRTRPTSRLYGHFFNAPVRPIYPWQARLMLAGAGFRSIYHRACPNPLLPREHRWVARKPS